MLTAIDDFDGVEARDEGVPPSTFNMEVYQQRRSAAPFYDIIPAFFRQQRLARPINTYTGEVKRGRRVVKWLVN